MHTAESLAYVPDVQGNAMPVSGETPQKYALISNSGAVTYATSLRMYVTVAKKSMTVHLENIGIRL